MKDWQSFVAAVVDQIKSHIAERLAPLEKRLSLIETKGDQLLDLLAEQDYATRQRSREIK
jgi:hypothetical protein